MCGAHDNQKKGRTTSPPSVYIDPARNHRQPSSVAGAEGASGHAQEVSTILSGSCQGLAPLINFFFFRFSSTSEPERCSGSGGARNATSCTSEPERCSESTFFFFFFKYMRTREMLRVRRCKECYRIYMRTREVLKGSEEQGVLPHVNNSSTCEPERCSGF
jgi:hypothetical protein